MSKCLTMSSSGKAVLLVQVPGLYWACRLSPWSLQTHGQWPAQGGTVVTTRGSYPTSPGACTCTFDINIRCMCMSGWTLIMIQIYKNPLYAFVLINTRWHSEIWQLLYPDSYPGQISQHDPDNLDIMYTDFWWIISLLFGCQGNVNTNVCDHCGGAAPVWTDGPHF